MIVPQPVFPLVREPAEPYVRDSKPARPLRKQRGRLDLPSTRMRSPRIPLELMLLVLKLIDSSHTLAIASRACRTLQIEAERLLYRREVRVRCSSQVRSLHCALTASPPRASLLRALDVEGNGRFKRVVPQLNEILIAATNLERLRLDLTPTFSSDPVLHRTVLRTLSRCAFQLRACELWMNSDAEFVEVLRRQPRIEALRVRATSPKPGWVIPRHVLPRLRHLCMPAGFLRNMRVHRTVTHLNITDVPVYGPALQNVLRTMGGQLVSLRCSLHGLRGLPVWPLIARTFDDGSALPRLRFLGVRETVVSTFLPFADADLARMTWASTALSTVVWSTTCYPYINRLDASHGRLSRLTSVRPWAKAVMNACLSLQRFFWLEQDAPDWTPQETRKIATLFARAADSGLLEESQEQNVPVWTDA